MSADTDFAPLPSPDQLPPLATAGYDPIAAILADAIREAIWTGEATSKRSLQKSIGFSELGQSCDRRLAHKLTGTPASNHPDPLKAIVGTGGHLILADYFTRLDAGTNRYLVEQKVSYRGINGTVDLFDRRRKVAIDWKFKANSKIKRLKREGVANSNPGYVTQVQGYGAALASTGEDVEEVALAFIPVDGLLSDIYVWRAPLDTTPVDEAIARLDLINGPDKAKATVGPLCPWCPYYRPGFTGDLTVACGGDLSKGRK